MWPYQKSFFITEPVSNNQFDYALRETPCIYVPALIEGTLGDVRTGDHTAIEALVGSEMRAERWLEHFLFLKNARVPTWICDNHNHAFVFWYNALQKGYIQAGSRLVHIDQHTDLATPESLFTPQNLQEAQKYTNTILTIADFIVPALATWLLSEALMVTGESRDGVGTFIWEDGTLKKILESKTRPWSSLIVDLDLDYFSQGFNEAETFATVRYWLEEADIITIATSPLFIEQEKALNILKSLQKELLLL